MGSLKHFEVDNLFWVIGRNGSSSTWSLSEMYLKELVLQGFS
jgi:hypothetical protein